MVGDAAEMRWKEKYLRDSFGAEIEEEHIARSWSTRVDGETVEKRFFADSIPEGETAPPLAIKTLGKRRKLNPAFDPTRRYVPRSQRKEWDTVGLMGKLVMLKGGPTNTSWRKMKDVGASHELWLVR